MGWVTYGHALRTCRSPVRIGPGALSVSRNLAILADGARCRAVEFRPHGARMVREFRRAGPHDVERVCVIRPHFASCGALGYTLPNVPDTDASRRRTRRHGRFAAPARGSTRRASARRGGGSAHRARLAARRTGAPGRLL